MADAQYKIKIDIVGSGATKGAADVNRALDSIAKRGQSASAANDNLRSTFDNITSSMGNTSTSATKLNSTLGAVKSQASAASSGLKQVGAAAHEADGGILSMIEHVGKATLAIAGLTFLVEGIHALADAFVEASNEATEVASRLAVVTTSTKGLADAQAQVVAISAQTRSNLTDTAELYQKIGIQADHLKLSTGGISTATKTFAETLKISGATQQQAAGSMRQLGEAFDIGKLSGVHYQAMMADNIVFMRLLAQSMGVPMGKLKELSTQGKVTAADLKQALTDPKLTDDIQKRFDRMPVSFADARTAIHNTLVQLAGDFGKGAGLNDALKSLYDQIVSFGQSAGPAFEKIGVAARAAFAAIAPAATAAWTAIKPVFSFVLDNAPALISLLKVAAEGWLAYKAATLAVSAVNLASKLATEVQFLGLVAKEVLTGASAFSELTKALKAATGAQVLFDLAAEANPYVAVATAIAVVIGLLYEFRDAISLGGGTMATLGDLFRAIWADIKSGVTTAITAVENVFSGLWNGIKTGVSAVGDWLANEFSVPLNAISKLFSDTFGDLDFSIAGILVGAARVADGLVGLFRGSVAAIGVLFDELPGLIYDSLSPTLQGIVTDAKNLVVGIGSGIASVFNAVVGFGSSLVTEITSVFNAVGAFIEKWANKAIDGINGIIGAADKLGAGIAKVAEVKIGQIAPPKAETAGWTKLGNDVGAAVKSGFGHEAENGVKGLLKQASQIGAARRAAGAHTTPDAPAATNGVPEGDASDGKRDKDSERRAKREAEFWATLKGEVETSKLLPLAAEDYKKQLELQKILGRDLNKGEIDRIASLQQQARTAKVLTDALDTHNKTQLTLAEQQTLQQDKLNGMTDEQLATEKAVLDFRVNAQERGVDLQDAAYKAAEAQLRIDQEAVQAVEARNKAITDGIAAAEKYSKSYQSYSANKDLNKQRDEFEVAYNGGNNKLGITKEVHDEVVAGFNKASKDIANQWANDMADRIDTIGQEFSGKIGKAIQGIANLLKSVTKASTGDFSGLGAVGGVLDLFTKRDKNGLPTNDFGTSAAGGAKNMLDEAFKSDTWTKPFKSMSDNFKGLTDTFKSPNGLAKGLGKALGQAGVGVQIGDSVNSVLAPLGKALGIQTSKLGSEIGGGLGSILGPVGSVVGSVLGGIVGGLFKKAPKGGTSLTTNSYGQVTSGDSFGNNSKAIAASQEAADSISSGLNQIAETLGGQITGTPSVTIGTYKGKWRVQTVGTRLKGGGANADTLTNFGKDGEADAIAYAIKAALQQGVLTGLSDFSEQLLKNASDIDAATALAAKYENVLKSLKSWQDPVGAAVDAIIKPLDQLITSMKANGATAADIANVETERTHELQEALKSNVSGFQDLLDTLNGEGSGKTSLSLLTDELSQLKGYQADLAAGKTVDQDAFTALANKIMSNAGDVYDPNSSAYQDIISALKDATTSAIGNYTTQWNADTGDTTTAAINSQTSSITAAQGVTNDYLSQILSALQGGTTTTAANSSGGNVNGKAVNSY